MPGFKEHLNYCRKLGISDEACNLANKLMDMPQEYLSEYILRDKKCLEYVSRKTGINKLDLFSIVYDKLISHKKLHMLCKSEYEEYRSIVKYVCEYYYGEEGVRAFKAHWNLDKPAHIAIQISEKLGPSLARNIKGVIKKNLPNGKITYYPLSSIINKCIMKGEISVLKKHLNDENRRKLRVNLKNFLLSKIYEILSCSKEEIKSCDICEKEVLWIIIQYPQYFQTLVRLIKEFNLTEDEDLRENIITALENLMQSQNS